MAELSTEYIKAIEKIIFKGDDIEDRTERHEYIQKSLAEFFRLLDFEVFIEYPVGCIHFDHTSDHNRDSQFRAYFGKVDIYVKAPSKIEIAIEFDNAATLKRSSIRKFLQSKANICIGVIQGSISKKKSNLPYDQLMNNNVTKFKPVIEETMYFYDVIQDQEKHQFLKRKIFYLGIINRKIFEDITPFVLDFIKKNKRDSFYYSL
ncbi:MAG: hypothetical protein ACFFBC_00120 [Promethearchaeota archaeon]